MVKEQDRTMRVTLALCTALAVILAGAASSVISAGAAGAAGAAEVNIYSYRKEALIRPQLEAFRKATGISYNLITGSAGGLLQRLRSEGINSPADILFTTDAGRLIRAKKLGLLAQVKSEIIARNVPKRLRDPDGYWFGLGVRARVIFYNAARVEPTELSTYEALTDPKWKGRLLVRSSNNIYNQSLLASLIEHHGLAAAETWARGLKANFARRPQGGDTDQIRAVAAGEGDIAIANTYYFGRLLASKKKRDRRVTGRVAVFWPNQTGRGAHVNISGAGVTKSARHRDAAIRLLEFLTGEEAQRIYATVGHEMPVRPGVAVGPIVEAMGRFKPDGLDLTALGRHNAAAVRIFDRVGWR
jgi:iron(III) transport system substrate-binding protein